MNITEELINTIKDMTTEEFTFFEDLMDSILEDEDTFEKVGTVLDEKLNEFDTEQFNMLKACLYYLGFKHGMEEGIRIVNEETKGETN